MGKSQRRSPVRLSRARKAVFAAVTLVSVITLIELAARCIEAAAPPPAVDLGLGFDAESRVFVPSPEDPGLLVTAPGKRVSFPTQTFRLKKPAGTYRIAVLGGSTVNFLDPELRVLQSRLRTSLAPAHRDVEIINAGGLSYGSDRLAHVAMELLGYELDLLILYSGHNEFEEVEQLELASPETRPLYQAASHLAAFRLAAAWTTTFRVEQLRREHARRVMASAPAPARAWRHQFTAEDVARRMVAFRQNSALVIDQAQRRGVAVIVGTLPSNLVRPYLPRSDWERYKEVWALLGAGRLVEARTLGRKILRESVGRHQASDLENDAVRALAREKGVPLADVEGAVTAAEPHGVPGETLFVDHCHLTDGGNRIVRETFEMTILRVMPEVHLMESHNGYLGD